MSHLRLIYGHRVMTGRNSGVQRDGQDLDSGSTVTQESLKLSRLIADKKNECPFGVMGNSKTLGRGRSYASNNMVR